MSRYVLAVIVVCLAAPAAAQSKLPIAVDQRVRLWTAAAEAVTGRVTAITADTVQVAADGREPVTVAVATVRRAEVSRGGSSKSAGAKKGALWGAIIAGALGAVSLGVQLAEDGSSAGKAAALGAWSGGLFGGLIGAGVGASRAGEKWEPVWP